MSRIAKKTLSVPSDVHLSFNDGKNLIITGKLGSVNVFLSKGVSVDLTNGVKFFLVDQNTYDPSIGSVFAETENAIQDVSNGYSASIKMIGVGFKANLDANFLRLFIGLSHDVIFVVPSYLKIKILDDTNFTINGFNRDSVMKFAKAIRTMKKPEPYNGKGIMINGEFVRRKEGKKK